MGTPVPKRTRHLDDAPPPAQLDVELVAPAEMEGAFRDWALLFEADPLATPFNSPEWACAWFEHWNPAAEPWLMRVRDAGRVVGIAPFAVSRSHGVRWLSTVGKQPGDYWDVIAAPADRATVAAAAGAELARRRRRWDASLMSRLPPESGTLERFAAAGLSVLRRPAIRSPAIALPDSFDAYLATLSRNHRSNLRRHLRRLDNGDIVLREITSAEEVPDVMARWRELRSRQWEGMDRQISSEHETDRFHRFMVHAARALLGRGMTVLWEFVYQGSVAAVYLNFADERSFYWYLGGFDPELSALGLGKIAIGASLRSSIESGRQQYDFTRGEESYKYWYGAEDRLLPSVVLGHSGLRSRAALAAARLVSRYRDRRAATPQHP